MISAQRLKKWKFLFRSNSAQLLTHHLISFTAQPKRISKIEQFQNSSAHFDAFKFTRNFWAMHDLTEACPTPHTIAAWLDAPPRSLRSLASHPLALPSFGRQAPFNLAPNLFMSPGQSIDPICPHKSFVVI